LLRHKDVVAHKSQRDKAHDNPVFMAQIINRLSRCPESERSYRSDGVTCVLLEQLEAIFPAEDKLRRHHEVVDWVLLCCRLCIRMNIANIGAICRLHPQTVRDILVHRIDEDSDQARMLGEKGSSWLTCLQELSSELSNGLLAWLPVEVHLNFTNTNMAIPGTFWDETNSSKLVEELVTCLASSDLGVRRSTYAFVVAQCHRRDFIGLLAHVTKLTLLDTRLSLCTISQYRSMDPLRT
jgi:hypothetical protein